MNYNFDCIAGYEEEKEELKRLCEIFNNRAKYEKKGAKLPKGIIFYGGAGTGKTLFAKVMASVCRLNILKIDLGESNGETDICKQIRKTFAQASRSKTQTMIFFDELDKVLPNDSEEYYTDRSKTVLAQLLTLIDGMDNGNNIVFVATCNYYDDLPETIVRPGRIDKKISLGNPTYSSRVEILKMYAKKSSCRFEMSMEELAKLCTGFSCAALETLINECILQSDENNTVSEELIKSKFFEIKNEDIPRKRSSAEDTVIACANIGSFIVAKTFNDGGYTLTVEQSTVCNAFFDSVIFNCKNDDYDDYDDYCDDDDDEDEIVNTVENGTSCECYSSADFLNTVTVILGGYVAEELIFHKIYNNMSGRFSSIDGILMNMSKNGMLGLDMIYSSYHDGEISYTDEFIERIEKRFVEITNECYIKAKEIVSKNEKLLRELIPILVEKETIGKNDCEVILNDLGGIIR